MGKTSYEPRNSSVSDRSETSEQTPYKHDASILLTSFFMKIVGLWLAKDHVEQRRRNLTLIYTVVAILFGVWVQTRDFYYSWPNFGDCVYAACNILCLAMVLLKVSVVFMHRKNFIDLLIYTHKHFWHTNYDFNEKVMIADCKRFCTLSIALINFCCQGSVVSYVLSPIMANIGKNQSDRILPFNMWVDMPLYLTPYYQILFVLQVLSLYHVGVCYVCFDNLLCLINLHVTTQFRILQYRLRNIGSEGTKEMFKKTSGTAQSNYSEECYSQFKCCVQQHKAHIQYCNRLESIFTIIVLAHILIFSLLVCLVGYQIFLAESSKTRRLIFIFNILVNLCSLLLFTSSCNGLIEESSNIGTAIYSGPWINLPMNKMGRKLRKDLNMVILRSRKPCCLTACGFFPVSLGTCAKVLSTAMSYFTLLRQSTLN
ncbi:odorant receptor Or2-like [Colletes latitarsis]|uniref:odorant receptor Or2-like n=1 Tax=Colletes latitarsis TaxID=2605962 RepID=UPI004036375D